MYKEYIVLAKFVPQKNLQSFMFSYVLVHCKIQARVVTLRKFNDLNPKSPVLPPKFFYFSYVYVIMEGGSTTMFQDIKIWQINNYKL